MTISEDLAGRVLPDTFAAQADTCVDPQDVLTAVCSQVGRRRRSARPALMITAVAGAVAAIVGISAVVVNLTATHTPSYQQVAAAAGTHPGLDQLSGTCLDMTQVNALWGTDASYGGVATGDACSHEADTIQPAHPDIESTITAANRTIYLAKSPTGIRAGFIALTPTESAAAIRASGQKTTASGQKNTTTRPQYLIVAIPNDNPQDVLVSILTQYQLPS